MERVDITVIGAGVVGLAAAAELSQRSEDVFVIERHDAFGRETSSRNSEVIHAGIYYPTGSLKHSLCIEGRDLLYDHCVRFQIPHRRVGKLIVALNAEEHADLEKLYQNGLSNGVSDLRILSRPEIVALEPHIRAESAIWSPSTGILDTHSFMKNLSRQLESRGGQVAFNSEVTGIDKIGEGYRITVKEPQGEAFTFLSRIVVNCAGLNSDRVAALAGMNKDEYRLKYCKGDYCRVNQAKAQMVSHLIYPVPKPKAAGLGIHSTLDLAGSLRLGPDDEYIDAIDYVVHETKSKTFYESARLFMPFLEPADVTPDMAGIRPKLQGPGEPFRDFIIKEESDQGQPGFVNLIGIESPGLTASLAIAKIVKNLITR